MGIPDVVLVLPAFTVVPVDLGVAGRHLFPTTISSLQSVYVPGYRNSVNLDVLIYSTL